MTTDFIEMPSTKITEQKKGLVCGVGVNDSNYITTYYDDNGEMHKCPYYSKWQSLLNKSYKKESGMTVCADWHFMSDFKQWMKEQDWQGRQLTSLLANEGFTEYSPETCFFLPAYVIRFLTYKSTNKKLPTGVRKHGLKFSAYINEDAELKYLGLFETMDEAAKAYSDRRLEIMTEFCEAEPFRIHKLVMDRLATLSDNN